MFLTRVRAAFNTLRRVFIGKLRMNSQQREGRIESVKRHRRWQTGLEQKQFFDQVFGEDR